MIKTSDAFRKKKAFIAYLMAGDPDLPTSESYILAAQEAGADLIAIGVPFSDPIAEDEVIQAASLRALQAGTRLDTLFDMVISLQNKMTVPMVLKTYLNPVFVYGYESFFRRCSKAGISGLIIPDLPYEEQDEAKGPAAAYGIDIITPLTTSLTRTTQIVSNTQGFVNLVFNPGTGDISQQMNTRLNTIIMAIRQISDIPIVIDLDLLAPKQTISMASLADGVIMGRDLVSIIGQYGREAQSVLIESIRDMKGRLLPFP